MPGAEFPQEHYRIGRFIEKLGKNILITDLADWSTDDIVQASLDRYMVENAFRQTKSDDLVSISPIRHWTDQKISCHLLSCVIALACLSLMELTLEDAGIHMSARKCMEQMRNLHSCLCWSDKKRTAQRMIEEPTPEQAGILKAFGYKVTKGLLQKING